MRAITICQPYAHLISLPDHDPRCKRIENRGKPWHYRGRVAIHAGPSRKFLDLDDSGTMDDEYEIPVADMAFGAVVAVARVDDCASFGVKDAGPTPGIRRFEAAAVRRYPWIAAHEHAEGPWCLILSDVVALPEPVPCRGQLGLWDLPRDADDAVRRQFVAIRGGVA